MGIVTELYDPSSVGVELDHVDRVKESFIKNPQPPGPETFRLENSRSEFDAKCPGCSGKAVNGSSLCSVYLVEINVPDQ